MLPQEQVEVIANTCSLLAVAESAENVGQARQWIDEVRKSEEILLKDQDSMSEERFERGKKVMAIECQNVANLANAAIMALVTYKRRIDAVLG